MNSIDNQFSKEAIHNRLIRTAANLWGVKNINALDPFVRLLMEAFSIEINRAANETQNARERMLDKLARLLTPNLMNMPYTAHAIMQVMPEEAVMPLSSQATFKYSKRGTTQYDGAKNRETEITFMPVGNAILFKGRVACMAAGNRLYGHNAVTGFKEPLLQAHTALPWATCYVGLELSKEITSLQNLSFYFNFASFKTVSWIYQLLPLIKINMQGNIAEIHPGLHYTNEEAQTVEQEIFSSYNMMRKMTEEIKTGYDSKYLTIKNEYLLPSESIMPAQLLNSFNPEQISRLTNKEKNIVWLELTFPVNYTYEMLEDMNIAINAVPVMNKTITKITAQSNAEIIPLRTDSLHEKFLAIHDIEDSFGRHYSEIPYKRSDNEETGYYSLRYGGVERFNERSAQDMLQQLVEQTRDEVSAFASIDKGALGENMSALEEQLSSLHGNVNRVEQQIKQKTAYIVVEPYDKSINETLYIQYWTTLAHEANNLREGTIFTSENDFGIQKNSSLLLTATTGGRDELKDNERLDAYRYALSSRDTLVTAGDIRNFCHYTLPNKIKEVLFEKGVAISPHPKQGYIRTVDIKIIPQRYEELKKDAWDELAQQLLNKIIAKSPQGNNYRVMIIDENSDKK